MAAANLSAALRAPAHPMAKAGYGKRHAPDQAPPRADDFAGLEPREAAIAAYVDRLPEGAAIGYKTLAEELPDYGQQACRSALDLLTRAGHLRRIRVQVTLSDGQMRWVTRTYFSRTARDADWWAAYVRFVRGMDAPGQPPAPAAAGQPPAPAAAGRPPAPAAPETAGEPEPRPGPALGGVRRPRRARPPRAPAPALRRRLRGAGTPGRGVAGAWCRPRTDHPGPDLGPAGVRALRRTPPP